MTFYERFEGLCSEVGLKPQSKEMLEVTGVSSPAISNWSKKGALPNAEVLCRIAKHFQVTTDYLLGLNELRQEKTIPALTEQERLLLEAYRVASVQGQFHIIQVCMNERDAALKGDTANAG